MGFNALPVSENRPEGTVILLQFFCLFEQSILCQVVVRAYVKSELLAPQLRLKEDVLPPHPLTCRDTIWVHGMNSRSDLELIQ